jgi:hypothetical protein
MPDAARDAIGPGGPGAGRQCRSGCGSTPGDHGTGLGSGATEDHDAQGIRQFLTGRPGLTVAAGLQRAADSATGSGPPEESPPLSLPHAAAANGIAALPMLRLMLLMARILL